MQRYRITRVRRSNAELRAEKQASNRDDANALFDVEVQNAVAGEEVQLLDTRPTAKALDAGDAEARVLRTHSVPTPDEAAEEAVGELRRWLERSEEANRDELITFAEKVRVAAADPAADPTYDLGWAQSRFDAAGRLWVARIIAQEVGSTGPGTVTHGAAAKVIDALLEKARYEVLRGARSPGRSTSATSNLINEARLAAWADAVEKITWARATLTRGL